MQKAVPLVASTDQPVRAVKDGKVVGIVDREAILKAMAEDPDTSGSRGSNGSS
jgi:CBS domain-containing protein